MKIIENIENVENIENIENIETNIESTLNLLKIYVCMLYQGHMEKLPTSLPYTDMQGFPG